MKRKIQKPDVEVSGGGTVFLITPLTAKARRWVAENVNVEPWAKLGDGFAAENRQARDIAAGMQAAGLVVV